MNNGERQLLYQISSITDAVIVIKIIITSTEIVILEIIFDTIFLLS